MAALRSFQVPVVEDNQTGWGPTSLPTELQDVPYAPFSKSDRLGRVADWTAQTVTGGRSRMNELYRERLYNTGFANTTFNFVQEEDEASFQLVVDKKVKPSGGFSRQNRPQRKDNRGTQNQRNLQRLSTRPGARTQTGKSRGTGRRYQNWRDEKPQRVRDSSVEVKGDFKVLEDVEFNRLTKLSYEPGEVTELKSCGVVEFYDRTYDRTTPKNSKPLAEFHRPTPNVTTSEDPEIRKFAAAATSKPTVFATDQILAVLMTCSRSVYPWDIIVNRVGQQLFFDKRPSSQIDYLTVCETSTDFVPDDKDSINSPENLALEATRINRFFHQQVLRQDERHSFGEPNPFADGEEVAPIGYRYRKWDLGDCDLVVRCEVDGVMKGQGDQLTYLSIKALNEFDSKITGVDWRQKLEVQRGAVLATELKNNSNKLAKWTAQAVLAGNDQLKLGYVSRASFRDNSRHVILGTQVYKPVDFASQINLSLANSWGIVKALVDMCLKLPEAKYLLMKDPNKPVMRLYEVPADAFGEITKEEADQEAEEDVDELEEDK